MTFVDHIEAATAQANEQRDIEGRSDAAREFALAITHLEDAQMRYTRGRAMQLDCFNPADLDQ